MPPPWPPGIGASFFSSGISDTSASVVSSSDAMDDEFYKRLGEHFTAAQIVELGFTCAGVMGLHRFIHTLDVYGESTPVIGYSSEQVDSAR